MIRMSKLVSAMRCSSWARSNLRGPGLPHLWGARSPSSVRLNPFRNRGLIAPTNNGRNRMIRPVIRLGLGLLAAAWAGTAGAAEIKLLSSAAMTTVLEDLVPKFEKTTGHKVTLVLATSGALNKRVAEGETADLLISTGAGIDGLIKDGKLVSGSRVDIARSGMGVAVKAGAPKPDISTPETFKQALLAAKSVAYTDPASGGASGIHFVKVLDQLGIAAQVNAKAKLGQGTPTADFIIKGEAELAIQQIPELKSVAGVDVVGPLPAALQSTTLLTSPVAITVIKEKGLDPGGPAPARAS